MPARDLEERVREALRLAAENAGDLTRAAGFADEAVRLAEEVDDDALLATALDARLTLHSGPDDLDIRLSTSLRLLGLVRQLPDSDVRLAAHVWRLTTALEQLDLSTVRRQLAALDLLADETKDDRTRFYACSRRAMFALTEGDSVGAARLAAEAAAADSAAVPEAEPVLHSLQAELARQRGDRAAMVQQASWFEERGRSEPLPAILAEAAVLWLESGEPERAGLLVDQLSPDVAELPRDVDWLLALSKLCEAAAGSGRTEVATTCAGLLSPYAGRAVLKSGAAVFAGVVDDYLALATGDVSQADQARAAYRLIGADWWGRRGPLGRPREATAATQAPRVLHLHPIEANGQARLWCVGREGSVRTVLPLPGLEYLRLLVERPGVDIPALDLSAAAAHPPVSGSGTGTLVGQEALAEHRRRLRDEPAPTGAPDDLGQRAELARTTVRRAIRTALARLELHDAEVAHELRTTIRTGATCRYEPDRFRPVAWHVTQEHQAAQRGGET